MLPLSHEQAIAMERKAITIPDVRFEQTFRAALAKESARQRQLRAQKEGEAAADGEAGISALVVAKVVVRDVLLMPLVQGALWTGLLITMKPWLRLCMLGGRRAGQAFYRALVGDVRPRMRAA